jgi:hypothetical protein
MISYFLADLITKTNNRSNLESLLTWAIGFGSMLWSFPGKGIIGQTPM